MCEMRDSSTNFKWQTLRHLRRCKAPGEARSKPKSTPSPDVQKWEMNHKFLITDYVGDEPSEAVAVNLEDGIPINKITPG